MPIVLAIEPDRRQAAHVSAVVRHRVGAELILADTTESALDAIGNRVPDLVLVPALLSPQDDAALAAALRVIAAAAHVRTLTIPVFANNASGAEGGGLLARFRRGRVESSSVGCDPALFADQIKEYLREAAAERADREEAAASAPITSFASAIDHRDESPFTDVSPVEASAPEISIEEPAIAASILQPRIAEPWIDDPPAVQATAVEMPSFDPYVAEAPVEQVIASSAYEPVGEVQHDEAVDEPPEEPVVDVPIEPMRMIAPAIVVRAKRPPKERPAPPAAIEFAEAATAEFGDRTFVDARGAIDQPIAAASSASDAFAEPTGNELVVELSDNIVETVPETVADSKEDLVDGERFGVYTLSAEELLDAPAEAIGDEAPAPPLDEAAAIASFAEFLDTPAAKKPADTSWLTLGLRHTRHWPAMEGARVESNPLLVELAVAAAPTETAKPTAKPADVKQPAAAAAAPAAPAPTAPAPSARADHLDWSELVASLRQDIERRRKQPAPAVVTPITPRPAETHAPHAQPHAHARPHLHAIEGKAGQRPRKSSAVQDEWGFFDPQQCGFAALLAKLDEFSEKADEPEVRKTS